MTVQSTAVFAAQTKLADDAVADFISALILSGQYTPGKYGVTDEAIRRHRKVHAFCMEHQKVAKAAPDPDLIRRKFPDFTITYDMPIEWASVQLHNEYLEVRLSHLVSKASRHLVDGDPHAAWQLLNTEMRGIQPSTIKPIDAFDEALMTEVRPDPIPVGIKTLQDVTGGIRPTELWYIGARPGRGKSWDLIRHAIAGVSAGWDVTVFSMEMSARDMSDRILAVIYGWDAVHGWDDKRKVAAAKEWRKDKGTIGIFDPSMIRCDILAIEAAAKPNTMLMVDHVGLMRSVAGIRASEDYKIAATVSNDLKEIAARYKVPVIAASQNNRKSESNRAPSLTDLAQTDAAGQDADLVYSITAAAGSHVQQSTVVKNRRGEAGVRWYTDFRPHRPSFEEISRLKAKTMLENESGGLDLL